MPDILTPTLGESVAEATVARWTKKPGDAVKKDEVLVELETDKVSLEASAPSDGALADIAAPEGATVTPGQVLGVGGAAGSAAAKSAPPPAPAPKAEAPKAEAPKPAPAPAPAPAAQPLAPSVQRIAAETGLDTSKVAGTGKDGRITKGDALAALEATSAPAPAAAVAAGPRPLADREERVKMTRLRQTVARRLKEAQNTAAMLTTFNEVDMTAVMALRNTYKDQFEKRHGVKLGFMGFFVKATIAALKEVPAVNAEIDGQDIVYKNHYDIGVAVGTEKGLVVPVVRDAAAMSLAEVEKAIAAYGKKARDGQLSIEVLQGGSFTIFIVGVYVSLLSTPILNAPQSGFLGM